MTSWLRIRNGVFCCVGGINKDVIIRLSRSKSVTRCQLVSRRFLHSQCVPQIVCLGHGQTVAQWLELTLGAVVDGSPYHGGCGRRDPLPWGLWSTGLLTMEAVVDGTPYHGGCGRRDSLPWGLWSTGPLTMGAVVDGTPYHGGCGRRDPLP